MTASSDIRALPVIAFAITSSANARLMNTVFGDSYQLLFGLDQPLPGAPDLLVVDALALHRHHHLIQDLRSRNEPMILPVLLISESKQLPTNGITRELGRTVDDILRVPTSRDELRARVDNLLRMRLLSRQQETARQELAGVVGALRTLNACDQVLVRSRKEDEMLQALCRNIVDVESYQLAWVSLARDEGSPGYDIHARAGNAAGEADVLAADREADPDNADGFAGTLRAGRVVVANQMDDETRSKKARGVARNHNLASAIFLPLQMDIGQSGYLAICSDRANHFNHDERQLLERLAANLGYALNTLRFQCEQERQSVQIHNLAFSDALTGLPNRHYLVNYLENMLANTASEDTPSAAILFIDLDGFKLINDVLGHEAGDQVLIQVAKRLQNAVRETDLVIRHGGDEFLVVLFDAPRTQPALTPANPGAFIKLSEELARRIIDHIKEPIVINEQEHRINASIGISLCPDHGRDASTVIQAADNAMYDAKRNGGGGSHLYSPEILEKRQQRLSLEARLRRAIADNELELHFQPLFCLKKLATVGVEALARWPQADGGMIMPGDFIPVAEETGLIRPLGDWALAAGARQLQSWHSQGYPLHMAVNLSVHQLYPDGDADHLLALVQPWIDPGWITLEVTESVLMVDPSAIEALLRRLKNHGFQIAIDDFGTGYSSLSRLQGLPLDTLKIDRSFVNQLDQVGKHNANASMIPIIQQMADSFGLHTVAEGIETHEQFLQLKAAGVELGQGFWFGRPVPEADIRRRIDESRKPADDAAGCALRHRV